MKSSRQTVQRGCSIRSGKSARLSNRFVRMVLRCEWMEHRWRAWIRSSSFQLIPKSALCDCPPWPPAEHTLVSCRKGDADWKWDFHFLVCRCEAARLLIDAERHDMAVCLIGGEPGCG